MSNALIVAKVINQISKGEIELDTTLYDPQLDAHTTRGWFMEQWETAMRIASRIRELL